MKKKLQKLNSKKHQAPDFQRSTIESQPTNQDLFTNATQPPEEFQTTQDSPDRVHLELAKINSPKEGPSSVATTFIQEMNDVFQQENPQIDSEQRVPTVSNATLPQATATTNRRFLKLPINQVGNNDENQQQGEVQRIVIATARRTLQCIFCSNTPDVYEEIKRRNKQKKLDEFIEYDLISPCSCNIKAHRECLKSVIINKILPKCPRCERYFTIDQKVKRNDQSNPKQKQITLLFSILYVSLIIGLLYGIIAIANAKDKYQGQNQPIKPLNIVIILVLVIFMMIASIFYIAYIVKAHFRSKVVDIQVYDSQKDVEKHGQGEICELYLTKFLRNGENKSRALVLAKAKVLHDFFNLQQYHDFMSKPMENQEIEQQQEDRRRINPNESNEQEGDEEGQNQQSSEDNNADLSIETTEPDANRSEDRKEERRPDPVTQLQESILRQPNILSGPDLRMLRRDQRGNYMTARNAGDQSSENTANFSSSMRSVRLNGPRRLEF